MQSYEEAVREKIRELCSLSRGQLREVVIRLALERNPDRVVLDAVESPELAPLALRLTRDSYDEATSQNAERRNKLDRIRDELRRTGRSETPEYLELYDRFRRTEWFRRRLKSQLDALGAYVAALREEGMATAPNAPNPRARAMRRLYDENLERDIPKGLGRIFLEEERAKDVAEARRKKEEARARKRAEWERKQQAERRGRRT